MPNTFFASDHHLGHEKILEFIHWDGTPIRPGFSSIDEMNEYFIERHNSVVGPKDTCWFLGDVVINRRYLSLIERFNGRKRLILGNHDIFKNKDYYNAGFEDLHAFKKFDDFVATHIPVHRESLRTSWGKNVHGHLHRNRIMIPNPAYEIYWVNQETGEIKDNQVPAKIVDPDYINVCMEKLNDYTPVSIDELRSRF
jgi:calcineurin-like phosphoesterase family protein